MDFYLSDDISVLGLSTRASNLLHRADVHTVEDLLNFPPERFSGLRNSGTKTVEELLRVVKTLQGDDASLVEPRNRPVAAPMTFWGQDGEQYVDVSIDELGLSNRSHNCLVSAQFQYASQLIGLNAEDLRNIRNMGQKSVEEILSLRETLIFEKVSNENSISDEDNPYKIIVNAIMKKVVVHGGDLLQKIVPVYETYIATNQVHCFDLDNCERL